MKHYGIRASVLCASLLAGCTLMPPPQSPVRIVGISDGKFTFSRLRAKARGGELIVRGHIQIKRRALGRDWGHIHIEVFSGQTLVAWTDTGWGQLPRHHLPTAAFATRLRIDPGRVDEVRVTYQSTAHDAKD